jgi:hypothetical protein
MVIIGHAGRVQEAIGPNIWEEGTVRSSTLN